MTDGWGGSVTRKWRAHFTPLLPLPCARCGLPVTAESRWHVGHQVDRALGGTHTADNLWPEHGRCSESAGGKLGHQLAGKKKTEPRVIIKKHQRREW